MLQVYLDAVSVLAPGLAGWDESTKAVISGRQAYTEQPLPPFPKELLPANERRRATQVMKLVLHVADLVLQQAAIEQPQRLQSVFASSAGDSDIIDKICSALTLTERPVSPTHFHNSVHNAPAGYWSIGSGCRQASTSLSAHDGSFSAGLLEAATAAVVEQLPTLLVAYDYPPPPPLAAVRYFSAPFAVAMLLTPEASARTRNTLTLTTVPCGAEPASTLADNTELEALRRGNPAARSLPLLALLASDSGQTTADEQRPLRLPYVNDVLLQIAVNRVRP